MSSSAQGGSSGDMGARLRMARKSAGISLSALAVKCGVSRSHLSRLELGEDGWSFSTLSTVAKALGLSVVVTVKPARSESRS